MNFPCLRLLPSFAVACIACMPVAPRAAEPVASISFAETSERTPASPAAAPESATAPPAAVVAVGIKAAESAPSRACDVILLFDTSASQMADYRRYGVEAVAALLDAARPGDRFRLAAVDVDCLPLAADFGPARGDEMVRAVQALESRTPLGSTDLVRGLQKAAELFGTGARPRAIVYVGDGPGIEGVDPAEFAGVIDTLRARRIAVTSLGIGPQINWPVLAALAHGTGGMLVIADENLEAKAVGTRIGGLAVQAVTWPEDASLTTAGGMPVPMLPARLPPLRSDRDSIILVEGSPPDATLAFAVDAEGGRQAVRLPLPAPVVTPENAFLGELARNARETRGVFLPILGREGLASARAAIMGEAATLALLSRQAEAAGSHASAVRLADASLRRDPDNRIAGIVRTVAQRRAASDAPPPPAPAFDPPQAGGELAELEAMRRVRAQKLEVETAVRIKDARQLLATDPERARSELKDAQESVRLDTDLDPAARNTLLAQLESRIREANVRAQEKLDRDLAAERTARVGRERSELVRELDRREGKIKQLMERYNALVQEGIRIGYHQAERYPVVVNGGAVIGGEEPTLAFRQADRVVGEEIARETGDIYANSPIPITARVVGRTAPMVARILDYDAENTRVKRDQERGFMDCLHLVDVAAIPFPDEPPIIYPDAARWREITAKRQRWKSVDLAKEGSAEQKIYESLGKKLEQPLEFTETPLREVQRAIEDATGLTLQLDQKALEEAGIDLETPVTKTVSGVTLKSALRILLGDLDLTYIVKDEVLKITTKEKAGEELIVKVYPVADLVLPVNPQSGVNPFQMGGGLGGAGAMGGMGGMGGMGMPMGGGGMGMGMGMGGGMMCWVAREVYGPHDARWLIFRGWITSEAPRWLLDLYVSHGEGFADWIHGRPVAKRGIRCLMDFVVAPRVAGTAAAGGQFQVSGAVQYLAGKGKPAVAPAAAGNQAAVEDAAEERKVAEAIGLPPRVLGAADLTAAIRAYFATNGSDGKALTASELRQRRAQLRNSAAWLGEQKDHAKAADLIAAAITSGQAEPWMYEALALAMAAAERPRSDVERVLLSSADFASGPSDLATLARYMARLGFHEQAIRVCRRLVRLEPTNREAYAMAMTLAADREDVATLLWACPGVLGHEWPAAEREIAVRAGRIAKSTIQSLEQSGRNDEAAALRSAVDQALVRDLVVELSWTGDADVDVFVEEPTGSVCSLTTPRTPAGGVLLADAATGVDRSDKAHKERYVVAEAFPGQYRILVRRVIGKVTTDTVTVRTTVRAGAENEETKTTPLRLAGNEQILTVELPDGRRREPLLDAQIAQDVVVQQHVTKTVLAQQLNSIDDPAVSASLADSPRAAPRPGVAGFPGFGRTGVVGYQPQISVLPDGVNLFARAVISADRRYVRVTCTPLFSGVGQVQSFGGGGTGPAAGGAMAAGGAGAGAAAGGGAGAGVGGAGAAVGGGAGAAAGAGAAVPVVCWVAREVYGDDNPRWIVFRHWLLTEAPAPLRDLYVARGEAFAAWIHDKPLLKAAIRSAMDRAVDRVLARAAVPCPDSE